VITFHHIEGDSYCIYQDGIEIPNVRFPAPDDSGEDFIRSMMDTFRNYVYYQGFKLTDDEVDQITEFKIHGPPNRLYGNSQVEV
jgi:hypothetical protein